MENLDVKSLIERYNNGTLSLEEQAMLESWYISEVRSNKNYQGLEENLAKLDQNFMHIIGAEEKKGSKLWPRVAVAASFFAVLGLSLYFYNSKSPDKVEQANVELADIDPAGNKAYLTLGNGKRIALTGASNGTIAEQANVKITKTADGQLVYVIAENNSVASSKLEYNTIETPNGGRYEIALPDGTHVWMNAASSLKYPSSFALLTERRVELLGEAYFQVAKDKQHPFIVKTAQQEVKVLGTHFNINSYADEPEVRTTLLEGSVNVSNLKSKNSKILKPGQQATLKGGDIKVGDADVDQAMSWKNGDFVFVGEDLKAVMRQVARWYDVEIEYQGNINSSGVVSTISRTKKLSHVLKALQINQGIHFKVEGRRVLVMP
ncbi:FecR family protein [Pedobacter frigiditerrae]|uniref:FecR family protein n=1 Tax=Pedobacter frigiditerrae TaxID=2530452 RepID=UPI00292DEB96|nr:FecR domain-containing protein [Pedobacter frigiditerrae]